MPIQIIRNDITKMACDAIVNAANATLLGGGGVDGAIHKAAGRGLLEECAGLGGCKTGEAKITGAYQLPCKYVIHTVGPIWQGGGEHERELLISCYESSLQLAAAHGCQSVAFPLISSGAYGYPKEQALEVATKTIQHFLMSHDMLVYIVVFDRAAYSIGERLFADIAAYIDDHYVGQQEAMFSRSRTLAQKTPLMAGDGVPVLCRSEASLPVMPVQAPPASLEEALRTLDESFSEMLLRKIDEKGMTDAACYKKANIDRKLFSKIRSDRLYKPSKPTAIAFALALELSMEETEELLRKAGFALSHSNKFDVIIEYFINSGNYNVFEINEALFAFDQTLLGA